MHDQLAHALASGLVRPALDVTLETLNVAEHLREVLPDRGLVRGRIVSCSGDAAMSLALQVVSRATQDGSWLAAVGVDHLGLVAAHEHRVALERLVVVNPGDVVGDWVAAVGIAVEGFGVVLLNVPRGLSARDAQRITTRIQSRRAVAVCVDSTRRVAGGQGLVPDVVLHTTTVAWHGIDEGSGHVRSREVCVEVSGRRVARPSRHAPPRRLMDRDVTRVVVVACPDWPAQAAVLDRVERGIVGGALAVVSAQRVVARTRSAGAEGIAVGMRMREAQGILPGLIVEAVNPQRDRTSFEPLVRGVCEIAPLVEVTEPGMVLIATQGPSRYFGGDEALAQRLQRIIGEATNGRITFGIGIADGRLAATVAAHHSAHTGSPVVVETGRSAKLLADLGVGVLGEHCGVDPQTISLLQRLGLRRLGDLVAIREATLVARFGPLGAQLHRLARGLDRHPPIVIAPPPLRITTHRTEEPVEDVGVVVNLARTLAEDLVAHLHAHALQCVRIHVSLVCDHGETSERLWYQPEGLSAAAIAERVRWQMEAFVASRIPTSGVVVIRLDPVGLEPANGRQLGLWGARSQADEDAHKAIAELTAALGAHAVRVPLWRGGRDPAEVFELTPAALVDLERRGDAVEVSREWSGALPSPSPSIVFEDRCEIEVHDAHDRQVSVSGRHELSAPPTRVIIDRRRCRVRSWAGPWPIEERWWDGLRRRRIVRMQLVIEDPPQGHKALLVILDNGRWSVSAEYR